MRAACYPVLFKYEMFITKKTILIIEFRFLEKKMIKQVVCWNKPKTESSMNTENTEIYKQARLSRDPPF